MFSELARRFTGTQHGLYALRDRLQSEGKPIVDLVTANVSQYGISFPQDILRELIIESLEAARVYRPDPFGQESARQAIAMYYKGALEIPPQQILLTPGSSISYLYCFKILAESADEILCPTPSYPLLDYVAQLCELKMTSYRLLESQKWSIDLEHLESQINEKTRAIVLISPHNPSGKVSSVDELSAIASLALKHDLAIISDEVFAEFVFDSRCLPRIAAGQAPLVFTLNGFSKTFALPGFKISWIAVTGRDELVRQSLSALETISDTFLPVNELSQFAVPGIFARSKLFLKDYVERVARSRQLALEAFNGLKFLAPEAGFYMVLPIHCEEEAAALRLLEEEQILVHPGHFYEIEGNHLVFSFIQDPRQLKNCLPRIRKLFFD